MIQGIVGIVILVLILYRQMRPRPLRHSSRVGIIIAVIGAVAAASYLRDHDVTATNVGLVVLSLIVGVGLAAVRGYTVRIYRDQQSGAVTICGTALTLVLWLIAIAIHIGLDAIGDDQFGLATLTLYIGLMILTQITVQRRRAIRDGLIDAGPAAGLTR